MSVTKVGIVEVSTVVFARATSTSISVGVPAVLDGVTVASIDADGLLTYMPGRVSEIALASGTVLRGVRALHENGDPYVAADEPGPRKTLLMVRAEDGGFITVTHEDVTIAEPTERTTTAYGVAAAVGPDSVQMFWSDNGGARRWRCPHWSVYFAGNPADWAGAPGTTGAALDRLASAVSGLLGVPIP